jgi:hypothetical protein
VSTDDRTPRQKKADEALEEAISEVREAYAEQDPDLTLGAFLRHFMVVAAFADPADANSTAYSVQCPGLGQPDYINRGLLHHGLRSLDEDRR